MGKKVYSLVLRGNNVGVVPLEVERETEKTVLLKDNILLVSSINSKGFLKVTGASYTKPAPLDSRVIEVRYREADGLLTAKQVMKEYLDLRIEQGQEMIEEARRYIEYLDDLYLPEEEKTHE